MQTQDKELERRMNMRRAHLVRGKPKDYQHGLMQTQTQNWKEE